MKLIGSLSSPYVRKVRIVMAEKKLDYEFVAEDVWAASTTIAASNPLGKVPCLVMEGGEALFDSRVIVEYLDALSPVGKLIPSTGRARASVSGVTSFGDSPSDSSAHDTISRASSSTFRAARPSPCTDEALPVNSIAATIAAFASGRSVEVALWSR